MNPSKSEKKKNDAHNSINSGAWSNNEDEEDDSSQVQFRRSKSLSRTKKVKKYLTKKLKNPLVAAVEDKVNRSSWYISQDKTNETTGTVESSCDRTSQNECVVSTESGNKYDTVRSRSSWYVDQEKWVDIQLDGPDNTREVSSGAMQGLIPECNVKASSKHVSRSSLIIESCPQEVNIQTIQNSIPRRLKQSKSEDGSCQTFERRSLTYKSLDNRSREKRMSNPFEIFQRHNALSLHKKSKENFVIDRNKLKTNIEQLTALKSQLNPRCPLVPFHKCDTKVQCVPHANRSTKSKSSLVHKKSILKQSKSSQSLPKITQECDLSEIPSQSSKENIPQGKPSYSDVLRSNITTVPDSEVLVELVSNPAEIDNVISSVCETDDHPVTISEDSGIVDPLSLTEDCSERISLSEEFSLSSEDLVSCIDFLDLNTESIVPPPCSTLSSNASFNSSLETVISASNNTLEDEEEECINKVPAFMKVRSMIFLLILL